MKQVTIFLLGGAYYDTIVTIIDDPWHHIRTINMFKDVGFRVTRLIKNKSI